MKFYQVLVSDVRLLISGITKKKKEDILQRLENGDIDIVIGTHALLEDNVVFKKFRFSCN